MLTKTHGVTNSSMLEKIAEALDITEAQYNEVIRRYTDVAEHLSGESSPLKLYTPVIKPQGSFLFGTMIKPIIEDDELDVDLVCRLKGKKAEWTQSDIKKIVGDRLKSDTDYGRMLDEEGNRCWTLSYHEAAKFHMDILPSVIERSQLQLLEKSFSSLSNAEIEQLAMNITDKRRPDYKTETASHLWLKSNPFGYAAWFKERASLDLYKSLRLSEAIDPLPAYLKQKEPLVRVVQILKRHRDIMFGGDDCKPISIIITTLAAKAYKKETNLLAAINNILSHMEDFIEDRYSAEYRQTIKWISNPVNDCENFADRWVLEKERKQLFYDWLDKAKK